MVGGGQLARMTSQAATGLGIGFRVLAGDAGESAAQVVAGTRLGDYRSLADLRAFAAGCDVLTFDHEHVPAPHLLALEQDGIQVRPNAAALRFTQDKLAMRERLTGLGIACPRFVTVRTVAEAEAFADGGSAKSVTLGNIRDRRAGQPTGTRRSGPFGSQLLSACNIPPSLLGRQCSMFITVTGGAGRWPHATRT